MPLQNNSRYESINSSASGDDLYCRDLPTLPRPEFGTVLVTGASGYIGGRIIDDILARGYRVRILIRGNAAHYQALWPHAEIVLADALNYETLLKALKDIHTAFYLIHSLLLGQQQFYEADIRAAQNFRKASEENNVKRIIYLGGLGDKAASL